MIREETELVIGLDGRKMSKSYGNTLPIFGEEKKMRKLVMGIKTDSTPVEEPKATEDSTILTLYNLFASEAERDEMVADYQRGGVGYGDFKKRVWEAYWEFFAEMRQRRAEIAADEAFVTEVLKAGADKAREEAEKVLGRVRERVGLS